MFGKFSEEAQRVLVDAQKEMSELKHPYIGSEHLLLAISLVNNYFRIHYYFGYIYYNHYYYSYNPPLLYIHY